MGARPAMAPRRDDTPKIVIYADYEVIVPPHELRKVIAATGAAVEGDDEPIARAEAALTQLSVEFSAWMDSECERLEAARQEVRRHGFTPQAHDALFRAAHDIKGEAATFGYPAVAAAAESLCRLIEHTPEIARVPLALVDQHVEAVRAIVRERARTDHSVVADALVRRLREVTDEFLREVNRDRPDDLESIFAPPLAP